jgi:hypothetical protein
VNREQVLALLAPSFHPVEVADGRLQLKVKDLTVRERETWRAASADGEGLKQDWLLRLLHLAVYTVDGEQLWPAIEDVDGPDSLISAISEVVLKVNGLASGSQKEAMGNSKDSLNDDSSSLSQES